MPPRDDVAEIQGFTAELVALMLQQPLGAGRARRSARLDGVGVFRWSSATP
jgi:hypothetical protein